MDHGPFNAVELLQQIGSHAFEAKHVLRDTFSGDERPIEDWEEFASFSEHSKLHRESAADKKAVAPGVGAEAKGNRTKTFFGMAALAVLLGRAVFWYVQVRG